MNQELINAIEELTKAIEKSTKETISLKDAINQALAPSIDQNNRSISNLKDSIENLESEIRRKLP